MTKRLKYLPYLLFGLMFLFTYLPLEAASNETLIIRGSDNYPPFEYLNTFGEPEGFNIDIIKKLMEELGYNYQLKLENWDKVTKDIQDKKIDIVVGMIYSLDRAEHVRFTLPICIINRNFITRKEDKYKSLQELKDKEIIVEKGGWSHKYLLASDFSGKIIESNNIYHSLQLLESGKHDAVLTSDLVTTYAIKQLGIKNMAIGNMGIDPQNYSIAVNQDKDQLLYQLNLGLQRIKLSGAYDQIYNKWFGIYESRKTGKLFFIALAIFSCIASLLTLFVWLLRRQVAKATRLLSYSRQEVGIAIDAGKISAWTYTINSQVIRALHGNLIGGQNNHINNIYEMIHPDDVETVRRVFQELSKGTKQAMDISFRLRERENSPYLYLETKMVRVEATKEHPCRIVGTFKNVTNEIQMRLKLEDYRIKSEFIVKTNGIVLMQYDIASQTFARINDNDEGKTIVITTDEYFKMIHPEDLSLVSTFIEEMNQGKNRIIYSEHRMLSEDGNYNWFIVNAVAYRYNDNDQISSYIGLRRNNTKWKNITNDLILLKEKADASNRLKSAFVANMSHEIRTPLNAIVGFSELIIDTENHEEKGAYIDIVRTNNQLLLQLINDVLDLSRIESGHINFSYSKFEFAPYFEELAISLKLKESENVQLVYSPPDIDLVINSDKNRIAQVITNFAGNAFKFTNEGSITLNYCCENNGIKISVTDTGIGISKENLPKIFERFVKTNDFAQGAGLGLSISKGIAEALHGRVGVESVLGVGSTFWVWLPCDMSEAENAEI